MSKTKVSICSRCELVVYGWPIELEKWIRIGVYDFCPDCVSSFNNWFKAANKKPNVINALLR